MRLSKVVGKSLGLNEGAHPVDTGERQVGPELHEKLNWSPDGEEPHHNGWLKVDDVYYILVDGAYVRDHIYIDYVEGGHYYRYSFIPKDEVWLEDEMSRLDTISTAVHAGSRN